MGMWSVYREQELRWRVTGTDYSRIVSATEVKLGYL